MSRRCTRRATASLAALAALLAAAGAAAVQQGNVAVDAVLRQPARLTAGDSDQFLGSLGPDGKTLYYASNRDAAVGAFATRVPGGVSVALFEEGADISLPRVSPDGRTLLYLSTRDDATGDVCLRDLPSGARRRCLGDSRTAESHAFFFPDGKSVGVVARDTMHGETVLRRVPVAGSKVATAPIVIDRSVSTPTISPDGRWLVYVPVERASAAVGVHFAMQLGRGLHVVRVDDRRRRHEVRVDLPGVTGFPAVSADGRWLYFVQYLHDSNDDGQIDGDDNGVVYRALFTPEAEHAVVAGSERQITSASWNCRYPAPGPDTLVLTCARGGRLDVYTLPLDGSVPESWGEARIATAIDGTTDPEMRAMLWSHLLRRAPDASRRAAIWRELGRLALQRGELTGASWFAARAAKAAADTADAGHFKAFADAIAALVGHRRAIERIDAGARDEGFSTASRARLDLLAGLIAGDDADGAAIARVVAAEINDDLGREEQAVALLEGVDPARVERRGALLALLELGVQRLRALMRHERALAWLVALSGRPALRPSERMRVAERVVALATRGRGAADRVAAIAALAAQTTANEDLQLRLQLELALLELAPGKDEAIRARVFELYRGHSDFDRRRALVAATLARAAAADSALLLYNFANTWASAVPRAHPERELAIDVFRQVVLERAQIAWNAGDFVDARASYFGITLLDDDLEAHLGFIESRLREGKTDVLASYEKRYGRDLDHPALRFARAWLGVRAAAAMAPDARRDALDGAEAELEVALGRLPKSRHIHHLLGWIAHQRFLLGDGRGFAVVAHDRYRFALALADHDPRIGATLNHALGLLQASVGNHRLALASYARRAALPFVDAQARLALVLARARSHWHIGAVDDAVADAAAAVALCDADPALRPLRPLALDRLALYAFEGDRPAEVLAAIDRGREQPAPSARAAAATGRSDGGDSADIARANGARAALVAAGAALASGAFARALQECDRADAALRDLDDDALAAGRRAHLPPIEIGADRLRAITAGLRARALLGLGRAAEAAALLDARLQALASVDDGERGRLDRAAAGWHRALAAGLLGRRDEALAFVGHGLDDAARFAAATGTVAPPERIWLLEAAVELQLFGGARAAALGRDLRADLRVVYDALCRFGHLRWERAKRRLGLYLSILDARAAAPAGATAP